MIFSIAARQLNLPFNRFPISVLIFSFSGPIFLWVHRVTLSFDKIWRNWQNIRNIFGNPPIWWLVKFTFSMKCSFSQQLAMSLLPLRMVNGLKTFFVLQIPKSIVFSTLFFSSNVPIQVERISVADEGKDCWKEYNLYCCFIRITSDIGVSFMWWAYSQTYSLFERLENFFVTGFRKYSPEAHILLKYNSLKK